MNCNGCGWGFDTLYKCYECNAPVCDDCLKERLHGKATLDDRP